MSVKQYLERFISRGPTEFSSSCAKRLQRTLTNGQRKEVPCWIELHVCFFSSHGSTNVLIQSLIIRNKSVIQTCCGAFQALEMKKPMKVEVTLTDGRVLTLSVDSSSTSAELCTSIAQQITLKDTFGFSIYISYSDKVLTLYGFSRSRLHFLVIICDPLYVLRSQMLLYSYSGDINMARSSSSDPDVCSFRSRAGL